MNQIPERFTLTNGDKHSSTWARLAPHIESRIRTLHIKLEGNQTAEETAILRGQIRAFKELLSLAQDLPPQT